jgi:two-component sensor histidine kinase
MTYEPSIGSHVSRSRSHDGTYRWMLCRAVADTAPDGSVRRWTGSFTDVHEQKQDQDQSRLVTCELTHRLQNVFAVLSAILMVSARSEPHVQSFAKATRARFGALALAHDAINPAQGFAPRLEQTTTLRGLLQLLLAPYQQVVANLPRIMIEGSDMPIGKSASVSLALLLHELATNALKHGALTAEAGRVHVAIQMRTSQLCLIWSEAGGPTLAGPPVRRGFGSALFERAIRAPLDARLERVWAPDGLKVRISLPLERLQRWLAVAPHGVDVMRFGAAQGAALYQDGTNMCIATHLRKQMCTHACMRTHVCVHPSRKVYLSRFITIM